ncbi:MAG: NnrU family protein [Saprospiraceae bacterium]|nr:NnrU family protein [Saprospiraceae bacterium]
MSLTSQLLAFTLFLAYFALHSILAADKVKSWFSAQMGPKYRYYRLIYNLLAAFLLLLLLGWMAKWSTPFLFEKNAWTNGMSLLFVVLGAWLILGSMQQYDLGEFTGIQQLKQKNALPNHSSLNTSGLNAFVRHPLYLGTILLLLGILLVFPKISNLLLLISVLVYLPFGIYFEEKKLRKQFGKAYLDYEKRVKCLIPGIW